MLKHGWSVVCEKVISDNFTNNLSLISCVEQINSTGLPAVLPSLVIVSYWYKEDLTSKNAEKLNIRVKIKSPDDKEKIVFEDEINVAKPRQRIMSVLGGYPFAREGVHFVIVQNKQGDKWLTVTELPIQVIYKPEAGVVVDREKKTE